ncbi:MAG TPA: hypothetical protein VFC07_12205 [Verrucomicrobiae bacterium]|nr:hypothetical protein [Verrucomicrobiae bacterium]
MTVYGTNKPGRKGFHVIRGLRIVLILLLGLQAHINAEEPQSSDLRDLTFESFLQHPPLIANAIYEITTPPDADYPNAVLKQTFTLSSEDTNYLLKAVSTMGEFYGGRFGGVCWRLDQGVLMCSDPALNPPGTPLEGEMMRRITVNRLLDLGIQPMVPGSVKWDKGQEQFTAGYKLAGPMFVWHRDANGTASKTNTVEGGHLVVTLSYEKNVPVTASVKEDSGRTYFIKYKYRSDFYKGRLPAEWTFYNDSSFGEKAEVFTLRLLKLELSQSGSSLAAFDPRQALGKKIKQYGIWSNGVQYWVQPKGPMQPVLSAEEFMRRDARVRAQSHPGSVAVARIVVFGSAALLPIVALIIWQVNKHNKTKEKV